jgi:electron transport complex protein RnfG
VRFLFFTLLLTTLLQAGLLLSPFNAMQAAYGSDANVSKKNILLGAKEAERVEKRSSVKLSTKIYRLFKAERGEKIIGYGILVTRNVRSKSAAVLYLIAPDGRLKGIEIVAFNEPREFIPSKAWLAQFKEKTGSDPLRVGKDIPTITGATLSARNVTDGSRLALALFETVVKESR